MTFNNAEIAKAVRARLAQLDKNNDLPVVLMPLDPEADQEQARPDTTHGRLIRPVD